MTSGSVEVFFRKATEQDLDAIKQLADVHRQELGFVRRPTLLEAIRRGEVALTQNHQGIVGFVHYHHRRDLQTTLYDIVVAPSYRLAGVGKALVDYLVTEARSLGKEVIILKCPVELPANQFYKNLGFTRKSEEAGKRRSLNIWQFSLLKGDEVAGG